MVLAGLLLTTLERHTLRHRLRNLRRRPWLVCACLLGGVTGAALTPAYHIHTDPPGLLIGALLLGLHPATAPAGVFLSAQQLPLNAPLNTLPLAAQMTCGALTGALVALSATGARGPALTGLGAAALLILGARTAVTGQ